MTSSADGGQLALAGFLYQIVGMFGLQVRAHCTDPSPDKPELEAFVQVTRDAVWHPESFGQDAVATISPVLDELGIDANETAVSTLVQFKYSRNPETHPIQPAELLEILGRLRDSASKASAAGQPTTGYALVTNRPLSPESRRMVTAAKSGERHKKVQTDEQFDILRGMHVILGEEMSTWEDGLIDFAEKYGAIGSEFDQGIGQLIHRVVARAAGGEGTGVMKADLVEAFTGLRAARMLTSGEVAQQSRTAVLDSAARFEVPNVDDDRYVDVRYELLKELDGATANHALSRSR